MNLVNEDLGQVYSNCKTQEDKIYALMRFKRRKLSEQEIHDMICEFETNVSLSDVKKSLRNMKAMRQVTEENLKYESII